MMVVLWKYGHSPRTIHPAKLGPFCNLSMLLWLVLLQTLEQYNNLPKIKTFISRNRVFLSKRYLILLISFNLNRQVETFLVICVL